MVSKLSSSAWNEDSVCAMARLDKLAMDKSSVCRIL
jgi:hypothetical protein